MRENNNNNTFQMKNIGNCHNLHVKIETLLLTDNFEHFKDAFLKTYKFVLANFVSPILAWITSLKR